jgi:hypothetical protein
MPARELEWQVEGGLGEGYHIDWTEHEGKAYLRWWEGDPEPAWPKVFEEDHLADMTAIEAEIAGAVRQQSLRDT